MAIRQAFGSAAAPAARCRNRLRGSLIMIFPVEIAPAAARVPRYQHQGTAREGGRLARNAADRGLDRGPGKAGQYGGCCPRIEPRLLHYCMASRSFAETTMRPIVCTVFVAFVALAASEAAWAQTPADIVLLNGKIITV